MGTFLNIQLEANATTGNEHSRTSLVTGSRPHYLLDCRLRRITCARAAAVQEQFLVEALAMGAGDSAVNQLLDVWKSGDGEALAALVYSASKANAEFYETIYYARNERMSDRLVELLREEPDSTCFAIVGAGHLIGDFSVVDRLEGGGYRMRRGGLD